MVSDEDLVFRSQLDASAPVVWRSVASVEGIAFELWPIARMTFPEEIAVLTEDTVPVGRRLCRSWILALGFIPIDYDDVTIHEFEPGRRFLERSPTLSQRPWIHERIVEPTDGGCVVTDRLEIHPRIPLMRSAIVRTVRLLFSHRHRRLVQRFGGTRLP